MFTKLTQYEADLYREFRSFQIGDLMTGLHDRVKSDEYHEMFAAVLRFIDDHDIDPDTVVYTALAVAAYGHIKAREKKNATQH